MPILSAVTIFMKFFVFFRASETAKAEALVHSSMVHTCLGNPERFLHDGFGLANILRSIGQRRFQQSWRECRRKFSQFALPLRYQQFLILVGSSSSRIFEIQRKQMTVPKSTSLSKWASIPPDTFPKLAQRLSATNLISILSTIEMVRTWIPYLAPKDVEIFSSSLARPLVNLLSTPHLPPQMVASDVNETRLHVMRILQELSYREVLGNMVEVVFLAAMNVVSLDNEHMALVALDIMEHILIVSGKGFLSSETCSNVRKLVFASLECFEDSMTLHMKQIPNFNGTSGLKHSKYSLRVLSRSLAVLKRVMVLDETALLDSAKKLLRLSVKAIRHRLAKQLLDTLNPLVQDVVSTQAKLIRFFAEVTCKNQKLQTTALKQVASTLLGLLELSKNLSIDDKKDLLIAATAMLSTSHCTPFINSISVLLDQKHLLCTESAKNGTLRPQYYSFVFELLWTRKEHLNLSTLEKVCFMVSVLLHESYFDNECHVKAAKFLIVMIDVLADQHHNSQHKHTRQRTLNVLQSLLRSLAEKYVSLVNFTQLIQEQEKKLANISQRICGSPDNDEEVMRREIRANSTGIRELLKWLIVCMRKIFGIFTNLKQESGPLARSTETNSTFCQLAIPRMVLDALTAVQAVDYRKLLAATRTGQTGTMENFENIEILPEGNDEHQKPETEQDLVKRGYISLAEAQAIHEEYFHMLASMDAVTFDVVVGPRMDKILSLIQSSPIQKNLVRFLVFSPSVSKAFITIFLRFSASRATQISRIARESVERKEADEEVSTILNVLRKMFDTSPSLARIADLLDATAQSFLRKCIADIQTLDDPRSSIRTLRVLFRIFEESMISNKLPKFVQDFTTRVGVILDLLYALSRNPEHQEEYEEALEAAVMIPFPNGTIRTHAPGVWFSARAALTLISKAPTPHFGAISCLINMVKAFGDNSQFLTILVGSRTTIVAAMRRLQIYMDSDSRIAELHTLLCEKAYRNEFLPKEKDMEEIISQVLYDEQQTLTLNGAENLFVLASDVALDRSGAFKEFSPFVTRTFLARSFVTFLLQKCSLSIPVERHAIQFSSPQLENIETSPCSSKVIRNVLLAIVCNCDTSSQKCDTLRERKECVFSEGVRLLVRETVPERRQNPSADRLFSLLIQAITSSLARDQIYARSARRALKLLIFEVSQIPIHDEVPSSRGMGLSHDVNIEYCFGEIIETFDMTSVSASRTQRAAVFVALQEILQYLCSGAPGPISLSRGHIRAMSILMETLRRTTEKENMDNEIEVRSTCLSSMKKILVGFVQDRIQPEILELQRGERDISMDEAKLFANETPGRSDGNVLHLVLNKYPTFQDVLRFIVAGLKSSSKILRNASKEILEELGVQTLFETYCYLQWSPIKGAIFALYPESFKHTTIESLTAYVDLSTFLLKTGGNLLMEVRCFNSFVNQMMQEIMECMNGTSRWSKESSNSTDMLLRKSTNEQRNNFLLYCSSLLGELLRQSSRNPAFLKDSFLFSIRQTLFGVIYLGSAYQNNEIIEIASNALEKDCSLERSKIDVLKAGVQVMKTHVHRKSSNFSAVIFVGITGIMNWFCAQGQRDKIPPEVARASIWAIEQVVRTPQIPGKSMWFQHLLDAICTAPHAVDEFVEKLLTLAVELHMNEMEGKANNNSSVNREKYICTLAKYCSRHAFEVTSFICARVSISKQVLDIVILVARNKMANCFRRELAKRVSSWFKPIGNGSPIEMILLLSEVCKEKTLGERAKMDMYKILLDFFKARLCKAHNEKSTAGMDLWLENWTLQRVSQILIEFSNFVSRNEFAVLMMELLEFLAIRTSCGKRNVEQFVRDAVRTRGSHCISPRQMGVLMDKVSREELPPIVLKFLLESVIIPLLEMLECNRMRLNNRVGNGIEIEEHQANDKRISCNGLEDGTLGVSLVVLLGRLIERKTEVLGNESVLLAFLRFSYHYLSVTPTIGRCFGSALCNICWTNMHAEQECISAWSCLLLSKILGAGFIDKSHSLQDSYVAVMALWMGRGYPLMDRAVEEMSGTIFESRGTKRRFEGDPWWIETIHGLLRTKCSQMSYVIQIMAYIHQYRQHFSGSLDVFISECVDAVIKLGSQTKLNKDATTTLLNLFDLVVEWGIARHSRSSNGENQCSSCKFEWNDADGENGAKKVVENLRTVQHPILINCSSSETMDDSIKYKEGDSQTVGRRLGSHVCEDVSRFEEITADPRDLIHNGLSNEVVSLIVSHCIRHVISSMNTPCDGGQVERLAETCTKAAQVWPQVCLRIPIRVENGHDVSRIKNIVGFLTICMKSVGTRIYLENERLLGHAIRFGGRTLDVDLMNVFVDFLMSLQRKFVEETNIEGMSLTQFGVFVFLKIQDFEDQLRTMLEKLGIERDDLVQMKGESIPDHRFLYH